jgi:hypothetical protein
MKIFLLIIYLMAGDLKVEKTQAKDINACIAAGNKRVTELTSDPRFIRGVFADCIEVDAREV